MVFNQKVCEQDVRTSRDEYLTPADKCQISSRVTKSLACMHKTPAVSSHPTLKLYQYHALNTMAASTDGESVLFNGK